MATERNVICHLISFLGKDWLLEDLAAIHAPTARPGQIPRGQDVLKRIQTHEITKLFWGIEHFVVPFLRGQTREIPLTGDFTKLLLLARDVELLQTELPPDFAGQVKSRYLSARQELFIAAANKELGNRVNFLKSKTSISEAVYDLDITTTEGRNVSTECKRRIGRDDERQATHSIVASFSPRVIEVLKKERLNYAILVNATETPREGTLISEIPSIIAAIKKGHRQVQIGQGKYTVNLQRLCDPGGGIADSVVVDITRCYSVAMDFGSPPSSSVLVTPRYYKYYNPYIAGIGLDRLQQESRDPVQDALKKANSQLAKRTGELGIVYYEENDAGEKTLGRTLKRIQGSAQSYSSIDGVVLYYKEEGVTDARLQKDVRPCILLTTKNWINKGDLKASHGILGISASFEPYIKSCNFKATSEDMECLRDVFRSAGRL